MSQIKQENIRNFSIIAHIDHGKSTIADRLIQICGGLSDREMSNQVLDSMDIEKERGITIKAQSVTLNYQAKDNEIYQLNFIDTPGHVDFSYEVSRSLSACEGALLGGEAQTVANCYTAIEQDLEVLPVLNKIDLPQAEPEKVQEEIENIIGIDATDAILTSAKTGLGIIDLLEAITKRIPAPKGDATKPLQALVIDSWFDSYLGVVSLIRIKQGTLKRGDKVNIMSTGRDYVAEHIGIFTPKRVETNELKTGQVGYLISAVKDIHGCPVGDTVTLTHNKADAPLPGFKTIQEDYDSFRDALEKLSLNDASLFFEPENSSALGFGFRCGFLGLLHMEIIQERLEREYNIDLITTAPTVVYKVKTKKDETLYIDSPAKLPSVSVIDKMYEPIGEVNILVPQSFVGTVMTLCNERRGVQIKLLYVGSQVSLQYEIPMAEIVLDFFDKLKSVSKGYASLDYSFLKYQEAPLVKVDILINGDKVDALAIIIHKDNSDRRGRSLTEKLKEIIPRQMFDIAIQATIGAQIIARSTVKALRKNVIAKCYGGDITRKKKLLEKQKAGKKRMKQMGNVSIPQDAFLAILKVDD